MKPVQPVYRNRPSIMGMIVRPRQQMRAAVAFIAGAWVVNLSLIAVLLWDYENLSKETIGLYILAATVMLSLYGLLTGVILTHRIFGPIVSLKRHLASLREGQYSARLQIRETDDLTELKDAVNDLAEALEQRHGSGQRAPS